MAKKGLNLTDDDITCLSGNIDNIRLQCERARAFIASNDWTKVVPDDSGNVASFYIHSQVTDALIAWTKFLSESTGIVKFLEEQSNTAKLRKDSSPSGISFVVSDGQSESIE